MSIIRSVVRPIVRSIVRGLTQGIDGFSPLNLAPTVLYDFYDRLSLYTDSAGTTQTRAPGTGGVAGDYSVGKVTDQTAGTQTTSTAKPAFSARYNLLTYSEDFSNAVWVKRGFSAPTTGETDPLGGSTAVSFLENNGDPNPAIYHSAPVTSTASSIGVWLKASSPITISLSTNGQVSPGTINVTPDWQFFSVTQSVSIVIRPHIGGFSTIIRSSGVRIFVWHPDLRHTSTATLPIYQSITDALTYDTVGFPPYVEFGVDDVLPNAVTLPAITGDIWIATTRGLYVTALSFAGGSFSFGQTTYTGGTAGLLSTIGNQIIGVGIVGYTLTAGQKAQLLAYYQTKGCQGVLL